MRREAKKGSGDNVPRQGYGDEIPIVPHREAKINKNLSGAEGRKSQGALARLCEFPMPEATIEIPGKYERISANIAEILLHLYQNRNCRLTAPLRFLLMGASHMGTMGISSPSP